MKNLHLSLGITATAALGILPALPATQAIAAPDAPARPNIIIITTDQQSWNMLSAYGAKTLATPAMDRLVNDGYSFRKTYAVNPVCMPSRFSLYTGHYASEIGTKDNTPHPSDTRKNLSIAAEYGMGHLFRKAGYDTYYSGKTHFYIPATKTRTTNPTPPLSPPIPGFASTARGGAHDTIDDYQARVYGFTPEGNDPYEGPVNFAKAFFATRKPADKPFLIVLSFLNPHDICGQAGIGRKPDAHINAESDRILRLKKKLSSAEYAAQIPPMLSNTAPINGEQPGWVEMDSKSRGWTKSDWSLYRWLYYRLTESVNNQIGRALAAFYASPFVDDTIIVFTSDHGDMQGAHGLTLKNVPFEECQRIPFVIGGPGIKKGVSDTATLVCNGLDLIPTLCDLTGIKCPPALTGKSLKPLLTGAGPAPERDCIYTETYNSFTLNDGRYKYTIFELPGNPDLLVDLQTDPGEEHNLAADPASQPLKEAMKAKLMKNLAARNLLPLATDHTLIHIRTVQAASNGHESSKRLKKAEARQPQGSDDSDE